MIELQKTGSWFDRRNGRIWEETNSVPQRFLWEMTASTAQWEDQDSIPIPVWNLPGYGWCMFIFSLNMMDSYSFPAKQEFLFWLSHKHAGSPTIFPLKWEVFPLPPWFLKLEKGLWSQLKLEETNPFPWKVPWLGILFIFRQIIVDDYTDESSHAMIVGIIIDLSGF